MLEYQTTITLISATAALALMHLRHKRKIRMLENHLDDLIDRAAQAALGINDMADVVREALTRLEVVQLEIAQTRRKLNIANDTLREALTKSTMAAARSILSNGIERVRCAGETEPQWGDK